MLSTLSVAAAGAFVTGLLGSAHCVGMCGGIVAAMSVAARRRGGLAFHLLYHAGRVTTYVVIGAALGALGAAAAHPHTLKSVGRIFLLSADALVITAGLGTLLGFARWNVMRLEIPAATRGLGAAARRLRGLPPAVAAYPLGLALGLLPCGFLYAVLINAAVSGSSLVAAVSMLGFGLGTAPALLAFAGAARWLSVNRRLWMLRLAGAAIIAMGVWNLLRHLHILGGHAGHG